MPTSPTDEESKRITDWIDDVLQTFPDDNVFLSFYLRVHKSGFDAQQIIRIARTLTSADPTNGWAYLELGRAQLASKDLRSAEESLQKAQSLGASPVEVIEAIADVYAAQQHPDLAFSELEKALQQHPDATRLGVALAEMAGSIGAFNRASVALEPVVSKNPEVLEVRTALVQLYLKQGLTQEALQHARKALALMPNDPLVMKTYALLFEALGQPDEALLLWSKLRRVEGYMPAAAVAMGRVLAARRDFAAAMAVIDGAIASYPASDSLVEAKVNVLRQEGRYREALRFLRESRAPTENIRLLMLEAQLADVLVDSAPEAYANLSRAVSLMSQGSVLLENINKRGALVAIRDNRGDLLPEFAGVGLRMLDQSRSPRAVGKTLASAEVQPPYLQVLAAILESSTSEPEALRAFASRSDLQQLALALANVPAELLSALVAEHTRKPFSDDTLKLLSRYGGLLGLHADGVVLPGGRNSEQVWRRFVDGISDPGNALLLTLVKPGYEMKLAFFLSLLSIDNNAQLYLTRNLVTLHSTYILFTAFVKNAVGSQTLGMERFTTFIGNLGIDPTTGIHVPGTVRAWLADFNVREGEIPWSFDNGTAAGGFDQSMPFLAAISQELSNSENPAILKTLNAVFLFSHCQDQVLTKDIVVVLRSNAQLFAPTLDLLCDFAPLKREQLQGLFSLISAVLATDSKTEQQVMFSELWSILELLRLARQSGSLDVVTSETLFDQAVHQKRQMSIYANLADNALDVLQSLVEYSTTRFAAVNTRQALLALIVPPNDDGRVDELNAAATAVSYFQKVPPIEFAAKCATLVALLRNRRSDEKETLSILRDFFRQNASTVGNSASGPVDFAKTLQLLMGYTNHNRRAEKLLHDVGNQGYSQVLTMLSPSISVALTGFIYAMYFSADDPIIFEDTTFVRRHQLVNEDRGLPLQGLARATLRQDRTGYYVLGRFQGLERIAAEIMVRSQNAPSEESSKKIEQIAALRSPSLRFVSNEQTLQCSLFIALAKEQVITSAMAPEAWEGIKEILVQMMSAKEMLALARATAEHRFEEAFALIGTARLYRLGGMSERTAGIAKSDSPVYQALAAAARKGAYRDSDPGQFDPPAIASARSAESLVLLLQELSFQNAVPASALMRLSDIVAEEVAITSVAEEQRRWTDVTHFRRIIDSAAKPSVPKVPTSSRQRTAGVDLDSRKGSSKREP